MKRLALAVCVLALAACGEKPVETAAPAETSTLPPSPGPAPVEAPVIADPLAIGSQAAKDDLYCAGVLMAAHPQPLEAVIPVEAAVIMQAQNRAMTLGLAGTGKMIDEGVIIATQAADVSNAWYDVAAKDFADKKPRLDEETCSKRADDAAAAVGGAN